MPKPTEKKLKEIEDERKKQKEEEERKKKEEERKKKEEQEKKEREQQERNAKSAGEAMEPPAVALPGTAGANPGAEQAPRPGAGSQAAARQAPGLQELQGAVTGANPRAGPPRPL